MNFFFVFHGDGNLSHIEKLSERLTTGQQRDLLVTGNTEFHTNTGDTRIRFEIEQKRLRSRHNGALEVAYGHRNFDRRMERRTVYKLLTGYMLCMAWQAMSVIYHILCSKSSPRHVWYQWHVDAIPCRLHHSTLSKSIQVHLVKAKNSWLNG